MRWPSVLWQIHNSEAAQGVLAKPIAAHKNNLFFYSPKICVYTRKPMR